MRISTKLNLFFAGVVVVFCVCCVILLAQIRLVSRGYESMLNSPVRDMDAARVVQVNFKKEVQEWKDILLRGHDPDDLAKYTNQFHEQDAKVQACALALANSTEDQQARKLLEQFLEADRALNQKYEVAYAAYVAGHGDFKAADRIVRGQDRAPTDLFDNVVARLHARVEATAAQQAAEVRRNLAVALTVTGGLLSILLVLGFLTIGSVLKRLADLRQVSDHLAQADIEGLVIDISGADEIAEFGSSLRRVHAAIQELLSVTSSPVGS